MTKADRADALRRRIALYRSYLRDGVSASLAREYLKEIAAAEVALAKLGDSNEKPASGKPRT